MRSCRRTNWRCRGVSWTVTVCGTPILGNPRGVGGGVLVYPSATDVGKYTTREQAAKTPEELEELAAMLPGVAAAIRGPALTAIVNDNCDNCRLQSICPAQPTGRMLTNGS